MDRFRPLNFISDVSPRNWTQLLGNRKILQGNGKILQKMEKWRMDCAHPPCDEFTDYFIVVSKVPLVLYT